MLTSKEIAAMIDHALLKPDMTLKQVAEGCETAMKYMTASVCVRGCDLKYASDILKGSGVGAGTVIGFPHGSSSTAGKVEEILKAAEDNGAEADMVIPIGMAVSGAFDYIEEEIALCLQAARQGGMLLKVIFENCYLTEGIIIKLCEICSRLGVDYVKTSTGFGSWGAKAADVKLMRENTDSHIGVKAAGGIRTLDDLLEMYSAGATRIGASATESIIQQARIRGL
ncbi:MAG: deoxyribose-phosphate aldolase [Eubacteriaceae bacterium]|nr:deoxyribose-phosphate aldolase [Eubacteriaceae bacterium]